MIWLITILASGIAWADGGCLQSPQLNIAITRVLKIPCEKFPQTVPIEELNVLLDEDLILISSDVDRLSVLKELEIDGDYVRMIYYRILLQGDVNFSALTKFEAYYMIKSIDTTHGKFIFNNLKQYHSVYFEGLRELLTTGVFAKSSMGISVNDGVARDLDFEGLFFKESVEIHGARSISNLVIIEDVKYLTITGPEKSFTTVSNLVYTSGDSIELKNVKFEKLHSPIRILDGFGVELINVRVDEPFFTSDSTFLNLILFNSHITIPGSGVLSKVQSFKIEGSSLIGGALPVNLPYLKYFVIKNSTVTIESFPQSKTLDYISVTGNVTILDSTMPIQVYGRMNFITLAIPGLEKVNIFLGDPWNFKALNVLGSPGATINLENLERIPKHLRVLVDRKAEALELRKILKLKSVGFLSE